MRSRVEPTNAPAHSRARADALLLLPALLRSLFPYSRLELLGPPLALRRFLPPPPAAARPSGAGAVRLRLLASLSARVAARLASAAAAL
jgi:hypothetical protein